MYSANPQPSQASASESWIDLSSRPSNSSLSSAAPDDIVTTGLRIHAANPRTRRRRNDGSPLVLQHDSNDDPHSPNGDNSSSQEEYEESESESDRVLSSSNEDLSQRALSNASEDEYVDGDDPDATALFPNQPCFTPQPNAFTHPPSSSSARPRASAPESYFPTVRPTPSTQRHSYSGNQQRQSSHSPYNAISPGNQADHEEALRASLTTLLSCAAAARSLPRKPHEASAAAASRAAPSARVDTTTLRMVPESVALGSNVAPRQQRRLSATSTQPSISPVEPSPAGTSAPPTSQQHDKNKRKANAGGAATASAARSSSKERGRAAKKPRRTAAASGATASSSASGISTVDPTLLTWVVSAGVLVLVSALSFSAGYVSGREAGLAEASSAASGAAIGHDAARGCGREVGRGLRRLRWGAAAAAGSVGA